MPKPKTNAGFRFPMYVPSLVGNEKLYVNECLDSTWISSRGKFISLFEKQYATYLNIKYASSVCNGTVALHLALLALDIKQGDEVIVPTLTYVATANAVLQVGAIPVFCDCLGNNWQIDPDDIEKKINNKTKAILVAHLYGHCCDMDAIKKLSRRYGLVLIEDCAEAIGTRYKGKHAGTFGDISTFSFFGNKLITTGEGGMVVSDSKKLIDRVNLLKNQAMSSMRYWHEEVGYNYRMTNICAAIGVAQLERIDEIIKQKRHVAGQYKKHFMGTCVEFHSDHKDVFHTYWMCSVLVPHRKDVKGLEVFLSQNGIDSRPLFYPVHTMPMYRQYSSGNFPVATGISARGINLPSYPHLTDEDIAFIAGKVLAFFNAGHRFIEEKERALAGWN